MELPKNITQIGEVDKTCKVYVEDYVVSYIKQLNQEAENRVISVALFGRHKQEEGIDYHFIYGACRVNQLPKEVRHLSQAQMQEVERFRRKYFPELDFAGYRMLNGEMVEGFHICDQDICRYIAGYACFYEKNDAMLAYMLDVRDNAPSEHVDQEKYEQVKRRQEERRLAAAKADEKTGAGKGAADAGEKVSEKAVDKEASKEVAEAAAAAHRKLLKFPTSENLQRMRLAAVGVFALLCLFGIATFREDEASPYYGENAQAVNGGAIQGAVRKDTLVMEDKLEQALRDENREEMQKQASQEIPDAQAAAAIGEEKEEQIAEAESTDQGEPESQPGTAAAQQEGQQGAAEGLSAEQGPGEGQAVKQEQGQGSDEEQDVKQEQGQGSDKEQDVKQEQGQGYRSRARAQIRSRM